MKICSLRKFVKFLSMQRFLVIALFQRHLRHENCQWIFTRVLFFMIKRNQRLFVRMPDSFN